MKNIFELIMPVLGLSICILAAQIPAVSWTTFTPFYYFVPHLPHQTNTIAVGPSLASESASPIIEKLEMTHLHRELSQIRVAIAQLTTKSDFHYRMNKAVEEILSNLQTMTFEMETKFAKQINTTREEMETKFAKQLNTIKEENEKDSQTLANKIKVVEEKLADSTSEIVDIGKMPTSCEDLQRMGHKLSGFFLVKGWGKIETVYCNFYPNEKDLQKWIGYADVKSAPVHFYVQRESEFNILHTPITFDLARVNEGNAMNLTSGIFTAPRNGTYFFLFTVLAKFTASSSLLEFKVFQFLNGNRIGTGYVSEANTAYVQYSPMTYPSTLSLVKGDRLWMEIDLLSPQVRLYDDIFHFTHFTGFMLEEEIVASL